jgi:LysR family transcriptional regulator, regulator for metE and metH
MILPLFCFFLMNLELRHLQLVQAVVEEGGVTSAGSRLGLSQSAVSHQLSDIERRLQAALFHRTGKRLLLTPAGERVLRAARLVLPELERAELDLSQNVTHALGTIRLAAECSTCYQWLPGVLRKFRGRHPLIEFQIVTRGVENIAHSLLSQQLDVAILTQGNRNRHFQHTDLFAEELMIVTAAGHRLADKQFLRPKDFSGELLFAASLAAPDVLMQRLLRPSGIRLGDIKEMPVVEAVLELVRAGFGIALLGRRSIQPYLSHAEFRVIPITARGVFRQWYAAIRPSKEAHVKSFVEALRVELTG